MTLQPCVDFGLLHGFVTANFSVVGSLAPRPISNPEDQGPHFVWPCHDLYVMGVPFFFEWLYSPYGPWPLFSLLIQSQSVGLLARMISSSQKPLPKHRTAQTQTKLMYTPNIHALSGIRTHDHGVRASEDSLYLRLWPAIGASTRSLFTRQSFTWSYSIPFALREKGLEYF
jgi:hypothetical protein